MKLKHYPVEKLKKEILEILSKHLNLKNYNVFFFGSRALGTGTERSDVDVGIEGLEAIPDAAWLEIKEEFNNLHTLYTVEIVDFKRVAPIFREVALRKIEPILEPL